MRIKKYSATLLSLSLFSIGSLLAQSKPAATSISPKDKAQADTLQYALGVYLAKSLGTNGIRITNPAIFKKGIDDLLANKRLMVSAESVEPRIIAFQQALEVEKGKKLESMLFSQLKGQPGVGILPSGVNYIIVKDALGKKPTIKDTVVLNVVGTLPDGTIFQDSKKDKLSLLSLVTDLIPGLRDGILQMSEGAIWRLILPASTAFGGKGNGVVPPNSAVIYDIGLVEVRSVKN